MKRSSQHNLWFEFSDLPGAVSIATDTTCREIIHNSVAAQFFRLKNGEDYPCTSIYSMKVKVFQNGKVVSYQEIPIFRSAVHGEQVSGVELEFVWQDEITKTAIWSSSPIKDEMGRIIGAIATFEEVTEPKNRIQDSNTQQTSLHEMTYENTQKIRREYAKRHNIEREIAKLERLNVIGQLAAGFAHEVRNPITTVKGFLQLLQNRNELYDYYNYFSMMIEELDRVNLIIQEFLALSKNKPTVFKPTNLNKLITNLLPLLQADAFNQGKTLVFEGGDIPDLEVDSNEIIQLILNLARNGLEAMSPKGRLEIRTYVEKEYVVLCVKDEGAGIKPEYVKKLGTPFFTTKKTGTGLGIPICYDIAKRHKATIYIETSKDGTTFFVKFPKSK